LPGSLERSTLVARLTPMVKLAFVLRRLPELSREEFQEYCTRSTDLIAIGLAGESPAGPIPLSVGT
jgi:hypothetical protein